MSDTKQDEPKARPPTTKLPLSIEARWLTLEELISAKDQLNAGELASQLQDGRAHVRANALLGLAAVAHGGADYIPFLRDGDVRVARAAAEALSHVSATQRNHVVAIAEQLDGARLEVAARIARMFSELVTTAEAQLVAALDTSKDGPAHAIIAACEIAGALGVGLLEAAARDDRTRVRLNAMRGLALLGDLDPPRATRALVEVEREDQVSDVRAAARTANRALVARLRSAAANQRKAAGPPPPPVPELDHRDLTREQAATVAARAPTDELVRALIDPRPHVRLNAMRMLAAKGAAEPATARSLAVLLRDADATMRSEAALALGRLGDGAAAAAPALVAALGDANDAVVAAVQAVLVALGGATAKALVDGLETPSDAHGGRVAALIGRLPDGAERLRGALASTSVDVRTYAAAGLGQLGARAGAAALPALGNLAVGGNARLRAAVTEAIGRLAPRRDRRPAKLAIDGFEDRALTEPELERAKATLAAVGPDGVAAHLQDVRPNVRSNAAIALGVLGGERHALTAALRDESPEVRLAAAKSLDKLADTVVVELALDVVRLLGDPDPDVVAQAASMLKARPVDAALAKGLALSHAAAGVLELIVVRPNAVDILTDAWASPAAQAVAARGFALLGKERLAAGRYLLEAARTDPSARTRKLARNALRAIDGEPAAPQPPAVHGFELQLLEASAFTTKLDPAALAPFLHDGRAIVRANAATALGASGAAGYATTLGALLKDDDARVRVAAAKALDKLGDDAVVAVASFLVGALGNAKVADAVKTVLAARKNKVEHALVAGLDTSDEAHGMRVAELICELPNAKELLFSAFDGPAQNATINAGFGIGLLGVKRAGEAGRIRLRNGLTGPITRKHHAMKRALELFGARV